MVLRWVDSTRGESIVDDVGAVVAFDEPMGDSWESVSEEVGVGDEEQPTHFFVLDEEAEGLACIMLDVEGEDGEATDLHRLLACNRSEHRVVSEV